MATKPPAKTRKAKVQPASGSEPASGNTQGIVVPKTAPAPAGAPGNPPVKPETPAEASLLQKAGELLEKGEIGFLNKAKDALQSGIDSAVGAAGGGTVASVVGAIGKGAVEVLMPTNVVDLVPGGKILSGGKKAAKAAEKALELAGKEAAEKAAKEAAEKHAKQAAGKNGAYSKGDGKKKNPNPCEHPNDKKKKKYVVYMADEFDGNNNKTGTYVGRTSGRADEGVESILRRRKSGHHRKGIGQLQELFTTDSYAGVRGAEQLFRDKIGTAKQINPISPKNKRKDDYIDCANSKGVK